MQNNENTENNDGIYNETGEIIFRSETAEGLEAFIAAAMESDNEDFAASLTAISGAQYLTAELIFMNAGWQDLGA